MGAARAEQGRIAGWVLVMLGASLTMLSFVDRRPISQPFPKLAPEVIVRPKPVANDFQFVKAPYPYEHTPWPYERKPGGALQLRQQAP